VRRASPGLLDAAVQVGVALYSLGRSEEAVREWQAVQARDPERRDAAMYLRLVAQAGPEGKAPLPGLPIRRDS
jgi:hypothetical protein